MVIGLLEAEISLPEARSLKDKRMVLRSLKDRILHRMNVSVAEVGRQDAWKHAELAFVTVASESKVVDKRLAAVARELQMGGGRFVLIDYGTHLL